MRSRSRPAATGKKLDMGKACLRFRRLDDLALDVVGEAIGRLPVDEFLPATNRPVRSPVLPACHPGGVMEIRP